MCYDYLDRLRIDPIFFVMYVYFVHTTNSEPEVDDVLGLKQKAASYFLSGVYFIIITIIPLQLNGT